MKRTLSAPQLLLFLFVAFRLSMLAFWPSDQLARWSDYDYYYETASWVEQGHLPYLDYWVEYPPIFPFLSVLLYLATPHFESYAAALGLLQSMFDAGSLLLLYRLARRIQGQEQAEQTAWAYALLFAPLAAAWLSFDPLATFCLLLAVERWMAGRRMQSALAAGVGGLVKWFPLLFVPVAWRWRRDWRQAVAYTTVAFGVVALLLGLLALSSPTYTLPSLRSLGSRASWETAWALLDGNLTTGAYQADRFDPAAATLPQGNPALVPTWLSTLLFGALYLWLWTRPQSKFSPTAGNLQLIRFTTLTVLLFFLWSRGWSPQWLGLLAPLLLLSLPLERAVLYLVVLTFVNLAEWPVLLSRGLDQWLYMTVTLRTALFVVLTVELGRGLVKKRKE